MLWKRQLEQIAATLPNMPELPWRAFCETPGDKISILDAKDEVILAIPVSLDNMEERLFTWKMLELYCLMRNNCELWFEEMKTAGISDIVLPKKKKRPPTPFVPVPAIPSTFNINDVISVRGEHYECKRTSESE